MAEPSGVKEDLKNPGKASHSMAYRPTIFLLKLLFGAAWALAAVALFVLDMALRVLRPMVKILLSTIIFLGICILVSLMWVQEGLLAVIDYIKGLCVVGFDVTVGKILPDTPQKDLAKTGNNTHEITRDTREECRNTIGGV
jgi:hypothetical protein